MAHPARDLHTMVDTVMHSGASQMGTRWLQALAAAGLPEPAFEDMRYAAHYLFETGRLARQYLPAAMLKGYKLIEPSITQLVFMQYSPWGGQMHASDGVGDVSIAVLDGVAEFL